MKHSSPAPRRFAHFAARSLVASTLLIGCATTGRAAPVTQSVAQDATSQTTSPAQTSQATASVPQAQPDERRRRANAYAKFLEGQRYLLEARRRGALTDAAREAATRAFAEAAALDPTLAEAHFALAELAFYAQNVTEAERQARLAIAINKDNYGAQRLLARLLFIRSSDERRTADPRTTEAAIKQLNEVTRLNPRDAEAWALLGELYERVGNTGDAITAFTRWTETPAPSENGFYEAVTGGDLSPANAYARLGQSLLRANRHTEATAALLRALAAAPADARLVALLGENLKSVSGANADVIITELRGLVARNPANTPAVLLLARTQSRQKRTDEAIGTLRAALETKDGSTLTEDSRRELQLALGETYANGSRFADAIAAYDAALRVENVGNAGNAGGTASALSALDETKSFKSDVLERILDLQRQQRDWQAADATVRRLRALLGDGDPSADLQAIVNLQEQGKREETLQAVRAARALYPEQPVFMRLEAATLAELGRVEEGVALLQGAGKGDADSFSNRLYIANIYTQADRPREAVAAAEQALRLAGSTQPARQTQALLILASARERAGDARGAEEALRRVLAREADNATALNNLGYFLVERGERLDEALDLINRALSLEPFNASFLDSLGWAHFKLSRFAEAYASLTEAARRNPSSPTIQEHLGDASQRLGKDSEARAAWQRALALTSNQADGKRLRAKLNDAPQSDK